MFTSALFFVVPFDRDADRGTGRIGLFVLIARTSCVPVLYSLCTYYSDMWVLSYIHTGTFTYLSTLMTMCVCMRLRGFRRRIDHTHGTTFRTSERLRRRREKGGMMGLVTSRDSRNRLYIHRDIGTPSSFVGFVGFIRWIRIRSDGRARTTERRNDGTTERRRDATTRERRSDICRRRSGDDGRHRGTTNGNGTRHRTAGHHR